MSLTVTPSFAPGFTEIYREHLRYVWNSLRRLGVPSRDLEDLVHEVFLVVHGRLSTYDPERPLRPWLFGICFRVASDYRRRSRNRLEVLEEAPENLERHFTQREQAAAIESRDLVIRALEGVDLERRAVLIMHDIDGHPLREIGESLGIPQGTAASRLRVAREEFTLAVNRIQEGEGQR